jgi:hypothetical protein
MIHKLRLYLQILLISIIFVAFFQHDFIDQTYHSILSSNPKRINLKFNVIDTDFSKGRIGFEQKIDNKFIKG